MSASFRPAITPGRLYALLCAEFARLRPSACSACRMPLPYAVTRPDEVSANWRIGTPSPCASGCDAVIAEIVVDMWARHDVRGLRSADSAATAAEFGIEQTLGARTRRIEPEP